MLRMIVLAPISLACSKRRTSACWLKLSIMPLRTITAACVGRVVGAVEGWARVPAGINPQNTARMVQTPSLAMSLFYSDFSREHNNRFCSDRQMRPRPVGHRQLLPRRGFDNRDMVGPEALEGLRERMPRPPGTGGAA